MKERSFELKKPAPSEGRPKAPSKFGDLGCCEFGRFWNVQGGAEPPEPPYFSKRSPLPLKKYAKLKFTR